MSDLNPDPAAGSPPPPFGERRVYVRLPSELDVDCHLSGRSPDVCWPGQVRNISPGGIGLVMRHRFRPGTALVVELRGLTGALLRTVPARVIYASAVSAHGHPCWLLGCAFDEPLPEEDVRALM
jgi:hypothetical protein